MTTRIFEGRTALVTGGSRGIGRAVCRMLADGGARVAINYRENEAAAAEALALVEGTAGKAIVVQGDVSQPDDVARMVAATRERLGPIDLLVNNAGIADRGTHDKISFQGWKRMFATNVDGPFLTTWAVKDEMIARRYGRIVNVSSIAGIQLNKTMIPYAATKAALMNFTRNCAHAFAEHNVRVNCVAPGLTNTDLARTANTDLVDQIIAMTPMGRMAEPEEIASVVTFLLSDASSFVTGQTIAACGGRT
jgi:3-oxoacyl-[acyl-carrier protein] reductase